jgi:hypothetical protein
MERTDWTTFREYLDAVFEQYGKPALTDAGARIMFENLRDMPLETVLNGLNLHVRMNRYIPPNAASVRELVGNELAVKALDKVQTASKFIASDASVRFNDHLIHVTIERCGGWTAFYFLTQAEKREQFLPAYAEAFRKRVDIGNAPNHAAGDWEKRGGYLHPWTPEKIIDVDAELAKREEQKRLTA